MPWLYSLHFKLVDAIREDRLADAAKLIGSLTELVAAQPGVEIFDLGNDAIPFGQDAALDYFRLKEGGFKLTHLSANEAITMRANVAEALDLLRTISPGLADEFVQIITAILVVRAVPARKKDSERLDFEGVSALRAFGGILLNAKPGYSTAACALCLVHEHAHNVLFALSPKQGVVMNSDDERYSSPLRTDPRPMEGILHAAFVLARMIYWLKLLRNTGAATQSQVKYAEKMITQLTPRYYEGVETIAQHGKLTAQGQLALTQAETFMNSAAA